MERQKSVGNIQVLQEVYNKLYVTQQYVLIYSVRLLKFNVILVTSELVRSNISYIIIFNIIELTIIGNVISFD